MGYLDGIVAGDDTSILHLDVGRRMGEFALAVRARALAALKLAAHLQLQPPRVFNVKHVIQIDVHHSHSRLQLVAIQNPQRLHFESIYNPLFWFFVFKIRGSLC